MNSLALVDNKVPWLYPHAGIARFFLPLLDGITELYPTINFKLIAPGHCPVRRFDQPNCQYVPLGDRGNLSAFNGLKYALVDFPRYLRQQEADMLLSPYYDFLIPDNLTGKAIITVHDLCFFDIPEVYPFWRPILHRFFLNHNLPRAGAVLTVSEFSKRRLLEHFPAQLDPDKVQVVYNTFEKPGIDGDRTLDAVKLRTRFGVSLAEKVILYTGGFDPRKNVPSMLKAVASLSKLLPVKLIFTGNHARNRSLQTLVDFYGLSEKVVLTGPLLENEMAILYQSVADCAITLSLYEGFGRSVIEAQLYGLPVVCPELEVAREMVGDYPVYCLPDDPVEVSSKLRMAMDSGRKQAVKEIDPRFNLGKNIKTLANCMIKLLG